jgi:hypothetical protein
MELWEAIWLQANSEQASSLDCLAAGWADRLTFAAAGRGGCRLSPLRVGVVSLPDGQRDEVISVVQRRRLWST